MTANNRIVLSSDHSAIALRLAIGGHPRARGSDLDDPDMAFIHCRDEQGLLKDGA